MSYCVGHRLLRMRPDYGCVSRVTLREPVSRDTHPQSGRILSSVRLTQYDMLPQHQINIRKLAIECVFFFKWDFSKERCSSLKVILGSKHVGAILNGLI